MTKWPHAQKIVIKSKDKSHTKTKLYHTRQDNTKQDYTKIEQARPNLPRTFQIKSNWTKLNKCNQTRLDQINNANSAIIFQVWVVRLVKVVQVFKVVKVVSLNDMHSENICFKWSKPSDYWEKLRCHACDWLTYGRKVESRAVFYLSRIRKRQKEEWLFHSRHWVLSSSLVQVMSQKKVQKPNRGKPLSEIGDLYLWKLLVK